MCDTLESQFDSRHISLLFVPRRIISYPLMLGMNLAELEAGLGFVFDDKSLLQRALTHRSFLNENPDLPWLDNERLEFLGDAILGFVTAEHLYHRFPEMKEGDLTSLARRARARANPRRIRHAIEPWTLFC